MFFEININNTVSIVIQINNKITLKSEIKILIKYRIKILRDIIATYCYTNLKIVGIV